MSRRLSALMFTVFTSLALQGCVDVDLTGLEALGDGLGGSGGGSGGGWAATCNGTPGTISSVVFNSVPYDYYTQAGDSIEIGALLLDGTCKTVTVDLLKSWSTSDTTVATVRPRLPSGASATAYTYAPGAAQVVITVNGFSGFTWVHVVQRVAEIRMNPATATIAAGDSVYVTATAIGVDGKPVTELPLFFRSDNLDIFSVRYDVAGVWIFGKKSGTGAVSAHIFEHIANTSITVVTR
jgi:hypothetical protein